MQHPKETKHAKNTVKLLQLGLHNIQVLIGERAEDFTQLKQQISQAPDKFSLCYPSEASLPIEHEGQIQAQRSDHTVIFIDASWRKALKMWHLNPWLHSIKAVHFANPPENLYAIRKTTQSNSLSTLEAVCYVLNQYNNTDCSALIDLFKHMQLQSFGVNRPLR
jgi:DTW domain-containing protein YfiP